MVRLVTFQGGLGNQLFQLSAALSETSESCFADVSLYRQGNGRKTTVTARQFELDQLLSHVGWRAFALGPLGDRLVYRRLVNFLGRRQEPIHVGRFRYYSSPFISRESVATNGNHLWDGLKSWLGDSIGASGRQAVHVRLGDYLALQHIYGSSSASYYRLSAEIAFVPSRPVYVFSEDEGSAVEWLSSTVPGIDWCGASAVSWEAAPVKGSWVDLLRMASCDRLVAGNSTYSWWAAWCSQRIHAQSESLNMIVAPSRMPVTQLAPPDGVTPVDWTSK